MFLLILTGIGNMRKSWGKRKGLFTGEGKEYHIAQGMRRYVIHSAKPPFVRSSLLLRHYIFPILRSSVAANDGPRWISRNPCLENAGNYYRVIMPIPPVLNPSADTQTILAPFGGKVPSETRRKGGLYLFILFICISDILFILLIPENAYTSAGGSVRYGHCEPSRQRRCYRWM